jgi:hypothetical protein
VPNKTGRVGYRGLDAKVLQQGFGLTLTRGGLSHALARMGTRCEPAHAQLKATVQASDSVTMDETGWRVAGCPHCCTSPRAVWKPRWTAC